MNLVNHKGLARVVTAAILVFAVATSLWFTSPVRALEISFPSLPQSATIGSTYSFQVKVSIEDQELLPIKSVDLKIYKTDNPSANDQYTGLPLASTNYINYSGTVSSASIEAVADSTWGYSYGYGYVSWQQQGYYFFPPIGYGYGYGYQGGMGTTSITYSIRWNVPEGWLAADDYKVEVKITANGNAFTQASNHFSIEAVTIPPAGGGGGPQPGVTYVFDYVTSQGKFTRGVTAESEDGRVKLIINKDTIGLDKDRALSKIKIKKVSEPPAPPTDARIVGLVYDITPDGATFEPSITISVTYELSSIPVGVSEVNLVIALWDEESEKWAILEGCTVDPITHTVSGPLGHFTTFTILAYTRPASFTVRDLSIAPAEAEIREEVTIGVFVTNEGDLTGSHEVSLTIDNVELNSKVVTLTGGAGDEVSFTTFRDIAGSYLVDVNGLLGTFVVKAAPIVPTPTPSTTPSPPVTPIVPSDTTSAPPPEPINRWFVVGGIIASSILFGVVIWLIARRRWA